MKYTNSGDLETDISELVEVETTGVLLFDSVSLACGGDDLSEVLILEQDIETKEKKVKVIKTDRNNI